MVHSDGFHSKVLTGQIPNISQFDGGLLGPHCPSLHTVWAGIASVAAVQDIESTVISPFFAISVELAERPEN